MLNIFDSPCVQLSYFVVNVKSILVTNKPLAIFTLTVTFLQERLVAQCAVIARNCQITYLMCVFV